MKDYYPDDHDYEEYNNPSQCPACGGDIEEREWTYTVTDYEGKPDEIIGTAFYCKNPKCHYYNNPII